MLVLTRKFNEQIHIGDDVTITILKLNGQSARIGIEAPRDVKILRGELRAKSPSDASVAQVPAEFPNADSQVALPSEGGTTSHLESRLPRGESKGRLLTERGSRLAEPLPEINSAVFFKRLRRSRGRWIH